MAKNSSSSGMFAIILIAVVLFFTNPTVDQFADWAVNEATEGATEVESFLGSVLGKPMVKMATERKDYYLFSIYTVSMDRETKVLGLGTKFFVISE